MNLRHGDLAANLAPPLLHLDHEHIADLEAQPLPLLKKGTFYTPSRAVRVIRHVCKMSSIRAQGILNEKQRPEPFLLAPQLTRTHGSPNPPFSPLNSSNIHLSSPPHCSDLGRSL